MVRFIRPDLNKTRNPRQTLVPCPPRTRRSISKFSKYPDEAEVLFRPNTVFEIKSTLYGASEIGQFYSGIDNIAMTELTVRTTLAPDAGPAKPGARARSSSLREVLPDIQFPRASPDIGRILVDVPMDYFMPMLTTLASVRDVCIDELQTSHDPESGHTAHVVMAQSKVRLPLPPPSSSESRRRD